MFMIQSKKPRKLVLKKSYFGKLCKIHWATPIPKSLLIKLYSQSAQIYQKRDTGKGFSCEFCEMFWYKVFIAPWWVTSSGQ